MARDAMTAPAGPTTALTTTVITKRTSPSPRPIPSVTARIARPTSTSPGTKTLKTSVGVTANRISGKTVAPTRPTTTSRTDSGRTSRRATTATAVAMAKSATATSSGGAVRLVEKIEQVDHARLGASPSQPCLDLHQAAGIGGDDDLRVRSQDVRDLAVQERAREIRLRDVVGARTSAAHVGLHERNELEAGDRREQRPRLHAHALAVEKVTRIVICRASVDRSGHHAEAEVTQVLGRIAHTACEPHRAIGPRRVVLQEPAVLLHRGSAPGSVHDDRVRFRLLERHNVPAGQRTAPLAFSSMRVERAAARLLADDDHLDPISREHARRRRVRRPERAAHDTTAEHRHARSPFADGRDDPLRALRAGLVGNEVQKLGEP